MPMGVISTMTKLQVLRNVNTKNIIETDWSLSYQLVAVAMAAPLVRIGSELISVG